MNFDAEARVQEILAMPEYRTRRQLAVELERVVSLGVADVLKHQKAVGELDELVLSQNHSILAKENALKRERAEFTQIETEMYRWQGMALAYRRVQRDLLENDGMELL